jgi:hypothetical protein
MSIETLQAEESEIEAPDLVVDTEIEGAASTGEGVTDPGGSDPEPAPIVSFDEDSPPPDESTEAAPAWAKELRRINREKDRELRELRAKVAGSVKVEAPTLGTRPTLDDPDVEFDEGKFATKLENWIEQKRQVEGKQKQAQDEAQKQTEGWNNKIKAYATERETLKGEAFEEAEAAVVSTLSEIQQGIIIQATTSPAKMVHALGMSPKKLAELAAITDPVRFAVEIGKLEVKMGSIGKRTPPNPETPITGTTRATSDSVLERLRAEAERTGDNSKVVAYKRSLRK